MGRYRPQGKTEEINVADEQAPTTPPADDLNQKLQAMAKAADAKKPAEVSDKEWRRHRMAAGQMVVVRSHFKSIYLIPMAIVSLVLGIFSTVTEVGADAQSTYGLIWVCCFCLYMNVFIFEWTRAWTFALILSLVALVLLGFLLDTSLNIWGAMADFLKDLNIQFSAPTYWFFGIFFSICAAISFLKTRLNYVVIESNEVQLYRNALFGDRERISMLNPRVEVLVPDMLEYFHPFYRAGTMIIHAPDRSIVLDNVLHIRRIERATDRLGSALSVRVSQ